MWVHPYSLLPRRRPHSRHLDLPKPSQHFQGYNNWAPRQEQSEDTLGDRDSYKLAKWLPAIHSAAPCSTVSSSRVFPAFWTAPWLQLLTFTLLVPGSSQRFLDKSRSLVADCIAYDLEDSVTPHMKAEARSLVRRAIDQPIPSGLRERAVRINSVDSGLALGDLTEVVRTNLPPSTS